MKSILLVICVGFASGILGSLVYDRLLRPPSAALANHETAGSASAPVATINPQDLPPPQPPTDPQKPDVFPKMNLDSCQSEVKSFCAEAGVEVGGAWGCLLDAYDKLGGECKTTVGRLRDNWKVCDTEIQRFCPDVAVGNRRIPNCLIRHYGQLGPACYRMLYAIARHN